MLNYNILVCPQAGKQLWGANCKVCNFSFPKTNCITLQAKHYFLSQIALQSKLFSFLE